MTSERRPIVLPNIVVGLATMALGGVLILSTLGVVDLRALLRFWPVLLVVLGATIVAQALWVRANPDAPSAHGPGYGWLVVLIVLAAIAGTVDQRRGVAPAVGDGSVNVYSVMSRQEQIISSPAPFQGGRMTSVMGSSTLDLRNAAIAPGGEAVVDVLALMGGLDLIVPDDWVVDVRTVAVMGGVEDSRGRINRRRQRDGSGTSPQSQAPTSSPGPSAVPDPSPTGPPPRVVVRGLIMMGGLNINP